MRMVESSQPTASADEDREAASAKIGGSVGKVDCEGEERSARRSARPRRAAYLHATNFFGGARSPPFPFNEFTAYSSDSEQPTALSLQPAHLLLSAGQVSRVEIEV